MQFKEAGLDGREGLVRRLLGSPALVSGLAGKERVIAIKGYEDAIRYLFLAGAGLAAFMVLVQAATGWNGAKDEQAGDEEHARHMESATEVVHENDESGDHVRN